MKTISSLLLTLVVMLTASVCASAQTTIFNKLDGNPSIDRTFISSSMINTAAKFMKSNTNSEKAKAMDYVEIVTASDPAGCKLIKKEFNAFLESNPDIELILSNTSGNERTLIYVQYAPDRSNACLTIIYAEEGDSLTVTVCSGENTLLLSAVPDITIFM